MPDRRRRRAGPIALLVLMVGALIAGCTAIPGSSAAFDVTRIADQVEPVVPDAPTPGAGPDQIVRGFIAASARPESEGGTGSSFAAARQYLTPDAQAGWQPSQLPVVILDDNYRTEADPMESGTVSVIGNSPGGLDGSRAFHSSGVVYSRAIHLVKVDDEWRISDPPPDLLLTASDFPTAYRQRVLYFLDPSGTLVVPDVRHIIIGQTTANRANRLLAMLLDGPAVSLQGAVTSSFSSRSALRSNPSVDPDGVLQIDFTGVDVSTTEARRALAAQVVWTLSPTTPRIAISVDGVLLDPAQPVYTINSVSSFDPDRLPGTGQVASDPFYVSPGGAVTGLLDGKPVAGPLGTGSPTVLSAAASATTRVTAAVAVDPGGGEQLLLTSPDQVDRADPALKADTLTQPSLTRSGDEAWVVQNGGTKPEVYRVSTSGPPSRERVPADELAGKGAVTALALSPDGVRVAVVVGDQLYLGVLKPAAAEGASAPTSTAPNGGSRDESAGQSPLQITGLTVLRSDLQDVGPITFVNSLELVVAAANAPNGFRSLWNLSIDGYESRKISDNGIFGNIDGLAAAVSEPLLITFSGRVWQLDGSQADGKWQSPVDGQPFLNGSAPFYPS
ncbi:LpqB family beta-propeller domain-containing protein [Nakamurella sp.]|uniref:LpqB family beta-propeller domain-containing protein n=1 Tax=Nakamurella sp. TaxID=1869182 RepID=UPI00378392DB